MISGIVKRRKQEINQLFNSIRVTLFVVCMNVWEKKKHHKKSRSQHTFS